MEFKQIQGYLGCSGKGEKMQKKPGTVRFTGRMATHELSLDGRNGTIGIGTASERDRHDSNH